MKGPMDPHKSQKQAVAALHELATGLASADHIVHEARERAYHRLIVNGVAGGWVGYTMIANCGVYAATTEHYRGSLPRVFIALDVTPDACADCGRTRAGHADTAIDHAFRSKMP